MPVSGVRYMLLQEQVDVESAYALGMVGWVIIIAIVVLQIAAWWMMFQKAGQPGWAAIIPIVNLYFLCKVAGKPGWWVILLLIPLVNIIALIIVSVGVARNFGKGVLFGIGLFILGFIFYPILGFGSAQYQPTAS
jgi:hypothetical protein